MDLYSQCVEQASNPEQIKCVRIWWKSPLMVTALIPLFGFVSYGIGKLGWFDTLLGGGVAIICGSTCFALLICLPMIWCASTGFNPYFINPHHCARHDYQFERRGTLCCPYCESEWRKDEQSMLHCTRHSTSFTSYDGGCPDCANAWQQMKNC